jgi:hypothetical protein
MQDSDMKFEPKSIAIGAAAGLAAALLCASSGALSFVSLLLFFAAPLPVMLAGLGWGPASGLAAVIAAFAAIAGFGHVTLALVIAATVTVPAAGMAHFASLAQSSEEDGMDWYPLSGILLRGAALVAAGFAASGILIGYSADFIAVFVDELVKQMLAANPEVKIDAAGKAQFTAFLTAAMPYAQPATWLLAIIGNFYAALHIARLSGLLQRPRDFWPSDLRLPRMAAAALAGALALSLFSGGIGNLAAVAAGTLMMAFLAVGLALFHELTLGKTWRTPALSAAYLGIMLAAPLIIPFLIAGIVSALKPTSQTHTTH